MSLIPVSGIPDSFLVPGTFAEILFGQGPSTASAGPRSAIYVMPMSSDGTWQSNQVVQVRNESDAADGAGVGSPLHRAIRMHLRANKQGKVYALPFAESTGGATAADGYFTITGTASATGLLSITVCGE